MKSLKKEDLHHSRSTGTQPRTKKAVQPLLCAEQLLRQAIVCTAITEPEEEEGAQALPVLQEDEHEEDQLERGLHRDVQPRRRARRRSSQLHEPRKSRRVDQTAQQEEPANRLHGSPSYHA